MAKEIELSSESWAKLPEQIQVLIKNYNAKVNRRDTDRSPLISFFANLKKKYGKGRSWIQSGPSKRLSAFLEKFSEETFLNVEEGGVSLDEVGAALRDITLYFTGSDEFGMWKTGKRMREAINQAVKYVPKLEHSRPASDVYSRFPKKSEPDANTMELLDILRKRKIFLDAQSHISVIKRNMKIDNFAIEERQDHIIIYIKTAKELEVHKLEKNSENFLNLLDDLFTKGTFKEHHGLTVYVSFKGLLPQKSPLPLPELKEKKENPAESPPQPRSTSSSRV